MMGRLGAALGPLLIWLCAARALAAHPAVPEAVQLAKQHLLSQGASRVSELGRRFLFEGEADVHEVRLEGRGCVGFLALGTGEVRDVDLALYSRSGQPLVEDAAQQPFAYARICGARGLSVYVIATLYSGRGELVLLRVDGAPRGIDRLPEAIHLAVSAGGRSEQARSVGSAPDERALDLKLEQAERALGALGYRPAGAATALELHAGATEGKISLEAQRCYRLAVYVPASRGVVAEMHAPDGEQHWEARSPHDDRVDVRLCPKQGGVHTLRIQARPMRGVVITRAFEHPSARRPEVLALGDARALAWAEAEVVARARGFELAPLGEAWVENAVAHAWPVSLEAGHCYAFALAAEGGPSAVDVKLVSEQGLLLARNEGRRGLPVVFTCADKAQRARLMLRARGQDGPVSLWVGDRKLGAP